MTKYVIDTVELIKRQYVVDAYTEEEAIKKMEDAEPILQEIVRGSNNIHIINEYEYKHSPDYNEGHDLLAPQQREMFDESNDIWRDD